MSVEILTNSKKTAVPIYLVSKENFPDSCLKDFQKLWLKEIGYSPEKGSIVFLPKKEGGVEGALFGNTNQKSTMLDLGNLARLLPEGEWYFKDQLADPFLATLALLLGGYNFSRYHKKSEKKIFFVAPENADLTRAQRLAEGMFLVRNLINTPACDLGPQAIEESVRKLASSFGAQVSSFVGEDLLKNNLAMIHAVGRASVQAPRLIDLRWGRPDKPKISLVGKGVSFDTGGLDLKSPQNMASMKKDMGGAANVLGLASMIMQSKLDVCLRVLIPAVENAVSGNAFRPGDILRSHKGFSVEVGDTDAEGRLILADALSIADEEEPALLVDIATLTGAARVALGPDVTPFFTQDDGLASNIYNAGKAVHDPVWRLPLWSGYEKTLESDIADIRNIATDCPAGAITAALFLKKFVERTKAWVHFDVFAWNKNNSPWGIKGGEAQSIRALEEFLRSHYS